MLDAAAAASAMPESALPSKPVSETAAEASLDAPAGEHGDVEEAGAAGASAEDGEEEAVEEDAEMVDSNDID